MWLVDIPRHIVTINCMGFNDFDEEPELWVSDACGVDPDNIDPSCRHPHTRLILLDDEVLSCGLCGTQWDADGECMPVVWGSFQTALTESASRYASMATVLENITGQKHCSYCGEWGLASSYVALYGVHLCAEHVGDYCFLNSDEELDEGLVDWMLSLVDSGLNLESAWVVERISSEYRTDLNDYFDDVHSGDTPVIVDAALLRTVGGARETTIRTIAKAVTKLLGLPDAASRHGRATVIGLLATGYSAVVDNPTIDDDALTLELARALPTRGIHRATVVMDLYRDEIPFDVSVNGELADSLLRALAQSSAAVLGPLLRNGSQG